MPGKPSSRGQLLRDTLVFQVKLAVDGLRDLVLSPVSLFAALLDLVAGSDRFYRLLELGRQSEQWINLFGSNKEAGLDEAVDKVEELVREQYKKGNMTETAREAVNKALDKLTTTDPEKEEPRPEQ